MPQVKPDIETFAKIKVVGVGGSGGSSVNRMIKSGIQGVEFWAMNTDVQALQQNKAPHKLHIGKTTTGGLGAGMQPEIGKRSAEESQNDIREALKDANMVFVTCGLGGGTGSGASPIVAQIARDIGALTVAVVTKPFTFEGPQRKAIADRAEVELRAHVDAIIMIPNDRILQIADKKTSLVEAFHIVDDVLRQGVQGISETITTPQLINIDFADVKTIMKDTGSALMGIGVASGESRAADAAKMAISSPLLDLSIDGARGILFTITGGANLGMHEVSEAAKIVTGSADDNARVIFGASVDESMGDDVRITVIATGFEDRAARAYATAESETREPAISKKPLYTSPLFSKKKFSKPESPPDDPEPEEAPRPLFSPKSAPVFTSKPMSEKPMSEASARSPFPDQSARNHPAPSVAPQKSTESPDVDLEIPTFIRKKMGIL